MIRRLIRIKLENYTVYKYNGKNKAKHEK